jgi:hypothetical protein
MQSFGSDPKLIRVNDNLYSLTQKVETLNLSVNELQFLIGKLNDQIEAQGQMLEAVAQKLGVEKPHDRSE